MPILGTAQAESKEKDTGKFDLKVRITNFKSYEGKVYAQLFNTEGNVIKNIVEPILSKSDPVYTFADLPIGSYAIRIFHDQNSNGKLDKNLVGIPKERFGFSNNVMGKFGPPSFEEQLFQHESEKVVEIVLFGR